MAKKKEDVMEVEDHEIAIEQFNGEKKKITITDFAMIAESITVRVEEVIIKDGDNELTFYVRELEQREVKDFQKMLPDTIELEDGTIKTLTNTTQMDMAKIVAASVVVGDGSLRLLAGGQNGVKKWAGLPSRIIRPLFEKCLEISGLGADKSKAKQEAEEEGKEKDS